MLETDSRKVIDGAPSVGTFFNTLRYNVVCEHGHHGYSPQAVDYVGEGFRTCAQRSRHEVTAGGNPKVCSGKLSLL